MINNTSDDLKENIKGSRSYLLDCNISYDYGTELMGGADIVIYLIQIQILIQSLKQLCMTDDYLYGEK